MTTRRVRWAEELPPSEHLSGPETPFSEDWEGVFESRTERGRDQMPPPVAFVGSLRLPASDMEALMSAAPHEEISQSLEATAHLREPISDAIDSLEPRLKWIFEARVYRRMSIREIGRELSLSKSYVARLYDEACAQLREKLWELL